MSTMIDGKKYLTTLEAAKRLKLTPEAVTAAIRKRRLKAIRAGSGKKKAAGYLIALSAVRGYVPNRDKQNARWGLKTAG